jgi:RNA polymerase sigma-70 factor (ECF subfamily)
MKAGDENAFTTLYRRRQGALYRFALHMSGCQAAAEDVTQEVFVKLMCEPDRFDPERGSLAAYLYGIARNQVWRTSHEAKRSRRFARLCLRCPNITARRWFFAICTS